MILSNNVANADNIYYIEKQYSFRKHDDITKVYTIIYKHLFSKIHTIQNLYKA